MAESSGWPFKGAQAVTQSVAFYFFIGSTYSYLSASRAEALAAAKGVTLAWRPFSLRTLLIEQENSPFIGKPAKTRYMWRDIERRAVRHGLPLNGIPPYPIDPQLRANRMAALAATQGWGAAFAREVYRTWFLDRVDPGTPDALAGMLERLGQSPDLLARVDAPEVEALLVANTDQARALGLFGSPSFVCADGELFWGDDRLEEALDWARSLDAEPGH